MSCAAGFSFVTLGSFSAPETKLPQTLYCCMFAILVLESFARLDLCPRLSPFLRRPGTAKYEGEEERRKIGSKSKINDLSSLSCHCAKTVRRSHDRYLIKTTVLRNLYFSPKQSEHPPGRYSLTGKFLRTKTSEHSTELPSLAWLLVCWPACLFACRPAGLLGCLAAGMIVCLLACLPACLFACLPACNVRPKAAETTYLSRNPQQRPK